jgi:hypothetical protein
MARPSNIKTLPAHGGELLPQASGAIVAAQDHLTMQQTNARAMALRMGYELPAGSVDADLIQRDILSNMRRSVEACLEIGRGLAVLRALCDHGEFGARLDAMQMHPRLAQRFMQSAVKFGARPALAGAAGNQSKLFELLVLDDETIEELELTGTTGELQLDKIAMMSPTELRKALRQAQQDADYEAERRAKAEQRADEAERKLRRRAPEVQPISEQVSPLMAEITDRHTLLQKALAADLSALYALDAWMAAEAEKLGLDPADPLPEHVQRDVSLVAVRLSELVDRAAHLVGALQHEIEQRFGPAVALSRQYLMRDPAQAADDGQQG